MSLSLSLQDLLDYTGWERQQWENWFRAHGPEALEVSTGPHGDGRFESVGSLVRHIFSAEMRYADRLSGRAPTETTSVSTTDVEALFRLGQQSREALQALLGVFPADQWDTTQQFSLGRFLVTATPRKIVLHVLLHELRHWGQVATLLRFQGLKGGVRDLLVSPVLGGGLREEPVVP
jgi:uncharacterized damage-inducible protein DinB